MNKNIAVIYASKYGTTEQYARWIAEALDARLMKASAVKPEKLKEYDAVIYGGGLYAGGIAGVRLVTRNPCKNLVVFTVGLADPKLTDYSAIIQKNLNPELAGKVKIFHLRGGINYSKLGPVHKVLMSLMKGTITRKPESARDAEDKEFLNTYGSAVNFTDKETIEPVVSYVKNLSI